MENTLLAAPSSTVKGIQLEHSIIFSSSRVARAEVYLREAEWHGEVCGTVTWGRSISGRTTWPQAVAGERVCFLPLLAGWGWRSGLSLPESLLQTEVTDRPVAGPGSAVLCWLAAGSSSSLVSVRGRSWAIPAALLLFQHQGCAKGQRVLAVCLADFCLSVAAGVAVFSPSPLAEGGGLPG